MEGLSKLTNLLKYFDKVSEIVQDGISMQTEYTRNKKKGCVPLERLIESWTKCLELE